MKFIRLISVVLLLGVFSVNAKDYSPDGEFFLSLNKPIRVNDINLGGWVYKLNASWKDPYGDLNQYDRDTFLISYGGDLSVLQITGKVTKYYAIDLNGDSGEEFVVEFYDKNDVSHLKAFSSGASNGENRGNVDMYPLNKVDVKSSEKDGFVIDAASRVINAKVKDKSGKVVNHVYKISELFDFKIKPVLLLRERLK
jgi:hypothetical protein